MKTIFLHSSLSYAPLVADKCGRQFSNILSEPGNEILQVGPGVTSASHADRRIGHELTFGSLVFLLRNIYS